MDESDLIGRYFRPLSAGAPGAFDLEDDAALVSAGDLVVTKDVLVEGVHFRSEDPLDRVARKALRVNLSDLAAKGARVSGYLLGCVWPAGTGEAEIADFARGLEVDRQMFGAPLLGGDTTRHGTDEDPLVVSITMLGHAPKDGPIRRRGARAGEDLYVTGTIGDAFLGLQMLGSGRNDPDAAFLIDRYHLPQPRLAFGGALAGVASAALDVSDGLMIDAARLGSVSGVAIDIDVEKIPLSLAAIAWRNEATNTLEALARLATGGDDYEILFTAPATRRRAVDMASQVTKTPVTRIGRTRRGEGVRLLGSDGNAVDLVNLGYDHFTR